MPDVPTMPLQMTRADIQALAQEIVAIMQKEETRLPVEISCEWARELLGKHGPGGAVQPISQQALKRRLDKIGEKSFRTSRAHSIKSEWLTRLRHV